MVAEIIHILKHSFIQDIGKYSFIDEWTLPDDVVTCTSVLVNCFSVVCTRQFIYS